MSGRDRRSPFPSRRSWSRVARSRRCPDSGTRLHGRCKPGRLAVTCPALRPCHDRSRRAARLGPPAAPGRLAPPARSSATPRSQGRDRAAALVHRGAPPVRAPVPAPPAAPPNRLERMSPKPPPNDPGSKPPGTPKPNGPEPRSYCLRLSASDRTSCACEISLKRSSAFLSPGLRSGWYWRASLR